MKKVTAIIICGGAIYIALAIATLVVGMGLFTPPLIVQGLLTFAGPCSFLLWGTGAAMWFVVTSVLLWSTIVMATRSSKMRSLWIAAFCLMWVGSVLLSYAFAV